MFGVAVNMPSIKGSLKETGNRTQSRRTRKGRQVPNFQKGWSVCYLEGVESTFRFLAECIPSIHQPMKIRHDGGLAGVLDG